MAMAKISIPIGEQAHGDSAMPVKRIVGAVFIVLGILLLGFGYHSSETPIDQISNIVTGRYTDQTMWYFILGTVALVGGGFLAVFGNR